MSGYLDASHSGSEQKIYSVMYRHERERHWGFRELSRLTGIQSDTTMRKAIDGLVAKASIEIVSYQNGNPLGPCYRVYSPKEIALRRRKFGIEVHSQTKKIMAGRVPPPAATPVATPAATGVATPVAAPVATGPKIYGGTPVETAGVSINHVKSDDDIAPLVAALRRLAPTETELGARTAAQEIIGLLVGELERATSRATEVPTSARFGVECIRRALRRGDRSGPAKVDPGLAPVAVPSPGSIYDIRVVAARLFEAHRGELGFCHDRLRELVLDALIGQGSVVDEDAVEEAIRGMAG